MIVPMFPHAFREIFQRDVFSQFLIHAALKSPKAEHKKIARQVILNCQDNVFILHFILCTVAIIT